MNDSVQWKVQGGSPEGTLAWVRQKGCFGADDKVVLASTGRELNPTPLTQVEGLGEQICVPAAHGEHASLPSGSRLEPSTEPNRNREGRKVHPLALPLTGKR